MKVIIYGFSRATLFAADTVKKTHEVLGISDSFAHIDAFGPYKFIERDKLAVITFDYIVICNARRSSCDRIKQSLHDDLNIPEGKIISFYALFYEDRLDQIMMIAGMYNIKYSGMILGLSHSFQGINPRFLDGRWCNLSVPGEDIYYHEKVFKKCLEQYLDVIGGLDKVIIDLYDYTVFGHDVSSTKSAYDFWSTGGYSEDLHNFSKNINYAEHDFEVFLRSRDLFSPEYARRYRDLRQELFDEEKVFLGFREGNIDSPAGQTHFCKDFVSAEHYTKHISRFPELPCTLYYSQSIYEDTVNENVDSLWKLVREIHGLNPNIKIYFVLIPRYKAVEVYHNELLSERKERFYSVVGSIMKEERVVMLDYKQCEKISSNNYFYIDPAHLNYYGSIAFTTMLNKDMVLY